MGDNDNRQDTELQQCIKDNQEQLQKRLLNELVAVQNRVYSQLESLSWLQKALALKWSMPPLRGWATSPDVLLRLHEHIRLTRPKLVVEFGSGASTLVIADALCQNGMGRLVTLEHNSFYAEKTQGYLDREDLAELVDIRVGELEPWSHPHLNQTGEPLLWYPEALVKDLKSIALLLVDGPPGNTCQYARYPAVPAMAGKLARKAEVWMDDTGRQDEKD
ncbi:MAG: class I SAM-dependent methyltransferase, partial [Bacillota bacterium]|nr:class I SAM-dependent methyltransferase [Bacillota bacterium]